MSDQNTHTMDDAELNQVSGGMYNGAVFVYLMKDGDTLDTVAGRYNTSAKILAELNNISNPFIDLKGKQIYVPSNF